MEITKRKYITTITYDKICNGVKSHAEKAFLIRNMSILESMKSIIVNMIKNIR